MTATFKTRREHRGQPALHVGQDHYEKSRIEARAGHDYGPSFAFPPIGAYREQLHQPADVTYRARQSIEKGSEPGQDKLPKRLKEAVADLDDGLSVRPN